MKLKCWYLQNGIYMDHTIQGYRVLPCCQYQHTEEFAAVDHPSKIHEHKFIKNIKKEFKQGIKHKGCDICWKNEKILGHSMRLRMPDQARNTKKDFKPKGQFENWDLRPSNICNIKCVMCQPYCSSKWYEDADIWQKYNGGINIVESLRNKPEFDWDYVKENAPNNAYSIYIAGGEPLYDKKVFDFIEYLSNFKWNLKNTNLRFNTNGISYTDKWDSVLSKFENVYFIVSMDGLNEVDEYIRFPTNFNEKIKQINIFQKKKNYQYAVNTTISALNFPVVQKQIRKYYHCIGLNTLVQPHFLHINSLKPDVVYKMKKDKKINNPYIADLIKNHKYSPKGNDTLKKYLSDLDQKRGTDSKRVLPWCWE